MSQTKVIPNLINGVSQQPDALRFPTQCKDQVNAYPSVVEGLTKRFPTEHVKNTGITGDHKRFVHTIDRQAPEQYTVIIRGDAGNESIKVFDTDGNEKTVELPDSATTPDVLSYLTTANADTALKCLTIGDVTYITNTEKTVEMSTEVTPSSVSENEALLFVAQAHDSNYKVDVYPSDGSQTLSVTSAGGTDPSSTTIAANLAGLLNQTASATLIEHQPIFTECVALPTGLPNFSGYVGLLAQRFKATSTNKIVGLNFGSQSNTTLDFTAFILPDDTGGSANTLNNNLSGIINSALAVTSAQNLNLSANADFTVLFNSSFTPANGAYYWLVIELFPSFEPPSFWASANITNPSVGDYTDGRAAFYEYRNSSGSSVNLWRYKDDYDFRFRIIQQEPDGSGSNNFGLIAEASGPSVYLSCPQDFSIDATNTQSDTYLDVFKDSSQRFSNLPLHSRDRQIIKIGGLPEEVLDDYYVKFTTTSLPDTVGKGTWEECPVPGAVSENSLNEKTMPHLLIKQENGTFVFKPADGQNHTSSESGTPTYDYSSFTWGKRKAGDTLTAPKPSFVGKKINDLFLYKNRVGILADENVVFTESGEYFNFFRTTVIDLVDTAPIDIAAASSDVSFLRHAVPLAQKLVLFSDQRQFILDSNTALTARTVSMAQATAYESLNQCAPVSLGNSLFFGFDRGSFSGVREYFTTDYEENFMGVDVTANVPKYLPGKVTKLATSSHENVVVCTVENETNAIYLYNYFNRGQERLQSAWHKFDLGTDAKILNIDFINTDLYVTVYRAEGISIEKLSFSIGDTDTNQKYFVRLDRRIEDSDCNTIGQTTGDTPTKTLVLPYKKSPNRTLEAFSKTGEQIQIITQTDNSNSIVVEGNPTDFYIGESYTMSYTFSDLTLKEGTESGGLGLVTDGRLQVRYITLTYGDTGYFRAEVSPDFRDVSSHEFTGKIVGSGEMVLGSESLESGEFRFPVFSKADQVSVTIKNDKPLPCKILSAEYEFQWNPRASRG